MTKQFNIRSAKAHAIALKHARARSQSLQQIVEAALEEFDSKHQPIVDEETLWGSLLRKAQDEVRRSKSNFRIEELYDPETGLPA
jgi:hypothetical protein